MERQFYIETGLSKDAMVNYLVGIKHDARATTMQRMEGLTQQELDWQPYEDWNSVGALLSHIIAVDNVFRVYFLEGRDLTEAEEKQWRPGLDLGKYVSQLKDKPLDYYKEELLSAFEKTKNTLLNLPEGKLIVRRFDDYDKVKGSDLAWIIYHAAEDEVHHRGQISILRKLYKMRG
jgi:uncharacterized damage-inducible protein DinB